MLTSVILANLVVGCVSIMSACFTVRSRQFGIPGTVLSIIGLILIGMSVWASAEFGASTQGVKSNEIVALQRSVENANVETVTAMKENNKQLVH